MKLKQFFFATILAALVPSIASAAFTEYTLTLDAGASIKVANYYNNSQNWTGTVNTSAKEGTSATGTYISVDPASSGGKSKWFTFTISANDDATAGMTEYAIARNAASTTAGNDYKTTISAPHRVEVGKSLTGVAANAGSTVWNFGSADTKVAKIENDGGSNSRNVKITGVDVGDTVCWATNRTISSSKPKYAYYGYKVYVYDTSTKAAVTVKEGENATAEDCTSKKPAKWVATSSNPSVAMATVPDGERTTVSPVVLGVREGTATITVSNFYHTATFKVTVLPGDPVELKDLTLGEDEEIVDFAEKTTGAAVGIIYGEVALTNFNPEGVARGERTKEGLFALVGAQPGETTAKIIVWNEQKSALYRVKVTVTPSIFLKNLSIQRGETADSLVREDTGAPINLDYDSVKALKSSVPEVADFVKLPNGKIGVVGKVTGTVDMTIVTEGQSYQFKVTVEKLLSGLYKAGAYDVAVSNASDVSYVDGDLVLIYRNVDAAVKKSFELPKDTTGRLLAVGGGGAGGQGNSKRDDSKGIPGGGGAGGLVIVDSQTFKAEKHMVVVGAGGVAPRTASKANGANGADTTVTFDGKTLVKAVGGGGGGALDVGNKGGSGGGGSYGTSGNGGGEKDTSVVEYGNKGGYGRDAMFGAGGGGAGGAGGDTTASTNFYKYSSKERKYVFDDPTSENIFLSGAGGAGLTCDITGENLEYARGGAGGVPRLYTHYYYDKDSGAIRYTSNPGNIAKSAMKDGKYFWVEASDGKPGRDGFGDGGGGSAYYSTDWGPTYAGSGGKGAVIVRIPPYKTSVEDALKSAFAGQPVTVSGSTVTLTGKVKGVIEIPDNLGAVTIKLNGNAIEGADGAAGDDITPGGNGESALKIIPHTYDCDAGTTKVLVSGEGTLSGGKGGDGHPQGRGAPALAGDASRYEIGASVTRTDGADGKFLEQHPHEWEWKCEDNKIYAICVADDGETCTYKERKPMIAFEAADAEFTGKTYKGLTLVNTVTEATGLPVQPPAYEGIGGTDYPKSNTPPSEEGRYRVELGFLNMTIIDTFTIIEPKPEQDSVYKSWKTATRDGDSVNIRLTATFSGSRAINDGNVLFLGSRCNAHSMATGTIERTINAMTKYADVRWYAYGSSDSGNNLTNQLTKKGEFLSYADGKGGGKETVHLVGANHFVHKEMMNDLYAELVEKKNLKDDYDLILLEFDGDLLCREGAAPYQLVYKLPEGWDDEKAARLNAVMEKYYQAGRVVWLVPDVNQEKSDAGYTGEYPWESNPEFIWQRAFLRATETEGYRNPFQKNYEDADELVRYIKDVLIGAYFQQTTITDTVKDGLIIKAVTPQIRNNDGFWMNMTMKEASADGVGGSFSLIEPFFGVEVTATVTVTGQKVVTVFNTSNVQQEAIRRGMIWGNDLRMSIDTEMDGFFDTVEPGAWKDTNEGDAIFVFEGSKSGETFTITTTNEPPKLQKTFVAKADPVIKYFDTVPTNIIVTVEGLPDGVTPIYEYSYSDEDGFVPAAKFTGPTNVSETAEVWCRVIAAGVTQTVHATATVLPRAVVEQAGSASKVYDGTALTNSEHWCDAKASSNLAYRVYHEIEFPELYNGESREDWADAVGFVGDDAFDKVPMTAASTITLPGVVSNKIDQTAVTFTESTKTDNYVFDYLPGELKVTKSGALTVEAFPAEKFYDAVPTNVTWTVKVGGEPVDDAKVYLREKGTEDWIEAGKFVPYLNATNWNGAGVEVEVKATKDGYDPATAESTVLVKPRIVVSHAKDGEWVYDELEHRQPEYYEDADEEAKLSKAKWGTDEVLPDSTGFVAGEGYAADLEMTDASKIKFPEETPVANVIDQTAEKTKLADGTNPENYELHYLDGELKVTKSGALTVEAFPAEKFYDAVPTNVTWTVKVGGEPVDDAKVYLREKGTEDWIEAGKFVPYLNATNWNGAGVEVEVKATKDGYDEATAESTVFVKPRIVVSHAKDGEWVYDEQEHREPGYYEDEAAEAEKSKAKWGTDEVLPGSVGFVEGEGYAADLVMTGESKILDPGTKPNVIDTAAEKTALKPNTKPENYELHYLDGELKVTTSGALTVEAFPAEKFYDAVPTNVTWTVKVGGEPVDDATVYLREKGTTEWVEAKDFVPYLNATNWNGAGVEVEVKAEKDGYDPATAESTVLVKPRIVVEHAENASKNYDGTPLRQPKYFEDEEDEAARSKEKWGTDEVLPDSTGFVDGEGFAADLVMTEDSQQTLVGEHANVIDQTAEKTALKPNTKLENYEIYYLPGSLIVVDATPYVGEYDAKEHSITVNVPVIPGVDPSEVTVTYSWDFGGPYTSLEALPWTDVVTGKTVWYKVEVPGYPDVYGSSTIDITPIPVHIVSNDDFKYFDGEPLTNWTGVATITTNGVTTTFDVGTEVPLVGDDKIVISYTGTRTEVGNSPNSFGYTFVNPEKAKNYIVTTEEGTLEVIQREEEVQRDEDFEKLPEETKEAIKEADKKVNEILDELTEKDQENSGESFVKYQLTVTKKDDLTEKDRTVPAVAAVDAVEQVKEIVEKTGKTPSVSEYVDVILERTYDKEEATNRDEKGKDGYDKEKWDQLDEAKDHNDIILSVMFPYEVPDGMELLGVTRSCHPDNNYDPDDATHGLLTAVPKVPEGQKPTQEGFYYDPETKTITLYAKDFCLFGFHLRAIPPPPPPPPVKPRCCNPCGEESSCCKTPCVYAYEFILLARSTEGKAVPRTAPKACACEAEKVCGLKCYRKPCMRKYAGFVVGKVDGGTGSACQSGCGCLDFVQPESECGEIPDEFVWGGQLFWDVRTKKAVDGALWFTKLDAIGWQSRETVEAVGQFAVRSTLAGGDGKTATGFVRLAGFGTRGRRGNGQIMVRSLSGFFAGRLPVGCTNCSKSSPCGGESCVGEWAVPWTICSDAEYLSDEDSNAGLTAAYGKWTLKWNDTAAARLTKSYQSKELVKPGYDPSIARETTLK